MKRCFITATGTGVGKTFITSALAWKLRAQGKRVSAIKPVISGFSYCRPREGGGLGQDSRLRGNDGFLNTDTGILLQAQELPLTQANIDAVSPWRFAAPISPDMAAEDEGTSLDFAKLMAFCEQPREADVQLVEGVGGVLSPVSAGHTNLDWMAALGWPVILVAGSYLGSISHTLAACEAVRARGLKLSVIISESEAPPVPLARLCASLKRFLPADIPIHTVTRLDSLPQLWKYAPDITSMII